MFKLALMGDLKDDHNSLSRIAASTKYVLNIVHTPHFNI